MTASTPGEALTPPSEAVSSAPTVVDGNDPAATNPDAEGAVTFVIDGVEVVVETPLQELPERASKVVFSGGVIDEGDGPRLCMGLEDDTFPPSCSRQPILSGFEPGSWPEDVNGVRWGDWDTTVSWPVQESGLEIIDISPNTRFRVEAPRVLPPECAGFGSYLSLDEVKQYEASIGDVWGSTYYVSPGDVTVIMVTDDPARHRAALDEGENRACVTQAERSFKVGLELLPVVSEQLRDAGVEVHRIGSGSPGGLIEIQVPVADQETVREVISALEDPSLVRILSTAKIRE